jgi:hypothetical protein
MNTIRENEPPQPSVRDLIDTCIGEKPDEFAAKFNELMRDRLKVAVGDQKTALSAAIFGTPEAQTDIADTIQQAHDETDGDDDETEEEDDETETDETE